LRRPNRGYSGRPTPERDRAGKQRLTAQVVAVLGSLAFLAAIAAAASIHRLPWIVLLFYVGISIVTFGAYWIDKIIAQMIAQRKCNKCRRIADRTLHWFGLAGGWSGAWLGQQLVRNKNLQPDFKGMLYISAFLHIAILSFAFAR
jgi:uncharacterized membrane protein YsdA (DUF1294 family)